MAKPIGSIEIIAYAPTAFYHCLHCEVVWRETGSFPKIHQEQLAASLPGDLAEEYQKLSAWVEDLSLRFSDQICIEVIDAASVEGFIRSLRYGVHRYPAVIIDGKARFSGKDLALADAEIRRRLEP